MWTWKIPLDLNSNSAQVPHHAGARSGLRCCWARSAARCAGCCHGTTIACRAPGAGCPPARSPPTCLAASPTSSWGCAHLPGPATHLQSEIGFTLEAIPRISDFELCLQCSRRLTFRAISFISGGEYCCIAVSLIVRVCMSGEIMYLNGASSRTGAGLPQIVGRAPPSRRCTRTDVHTLALWGPRSLRCEWRCWGTGRCW